MNTRNLSFLKFIYRSSSLAEAMSCLAVGIGINWIYKGLKGINNSLFFLSYLGLVFLLTGIFSLYFSFQKAKLIYDNGLEISGKVFVSYFRFGYGIITCEHFYQGRIYRSSHRVSRLRWEKVLKPGQNIILIMDRNNPQKVFIRDFYQ